MYQLLSLVSADQLQEDKEGTLVSLKNVTIESVSGGNFTAKDENGTSFVIRPQDASLLTVGTTYDSVTGVLGSYNRRLSAYSKKFWRCCPKCIGCSICFRNSW